MNKVKVTLWDRLFDIEVSYSCYPGEEITELQKEAIKEFAKMENPTADSMSDLKKYISSTSEGEITTSDIDNIFKYVMPKTIFIPRSKTKMVAIICNYKFDMEHGIAVVFENGKLNKIGTQDIII